MKYILLVVTISAAMCGMEQQTEKSEKNPSSENTFEADWIRMKELVEELDTPQLQAFDWEHLREVSREMRKQEKKEASQLMEEEAATIKKIMACDEWFWRNH